MCISNNRSMLYIYIEALANDREQRAMRINQRVLSTNEWNFS